MKEIHVKFAGIEKAPNSELFSIIYIPDTRQVLLPGQRYRIIIDGLGFGESKPKERMVMGLEEMTNRSPSYWMRPAR